MTTHYELHVRKPDGRTFEMAQHHGGWWGPHERAQAEEAALRWAGIRPENEYQVYEVQTSRTLVAKFGGVP